MSDQLTKQQQYQLLDLHLAPAADKLNALSAELQKKLVDMMEIESSFDYSSFMPNTEPYYNYADISDLTGLWLQKVTNDGNEIVFHTAIGNLAIFHRQDCCESVYVEDSDGAEELTGLVISAEAVYNDPPEPPSPSIDNNGYHYTAESETWTWYKIITTSGESTIRFYGSSNGYYSESVECEWRAKS